MALRKCSFAPADGVVDLDSELSAAGPLSCSSVLSPGDLAWLLHGRHDGRAESGDAPERSVAQMVFATSMGGSSARSPVSRRCTNFSRGRNAHRSDPHHGWLGHPVAQVPPAWLAAVERDESSVTSSQR